MGSCYWIFDFSGKTKSFTSVRFPLWKFVFSCHWVISVTFFQVPFDICSILSWRACTKAMLFHHEVILEKVEGGSVTDHRNTVPLLLKLKLHQWCGTGTQTLLTENQEQSCQPGDSLKKEVKYVNFLGLSVPLLEACKHYERPGNFCQFNFWQVHSVRELESQWVFWLLFWVLLHGLCFTMT